MALSGSFPCPGSTFKCNSPQQFRTPPCSGEDVLLGHQPPVDCLRSPKQTLLLPIPSRLFWTTLMTTGFEPLVGVFGGVATRESTRTRRRKASMWHKSPGRTDGVFVFILCCLCLCSVFNCTWMWAVSTISFEPTYQASHVPEIG